MPKTAVKEKPKKMSKIALWWQKNPNGLEGSYDLKTILREYDTPWWETPMGAKG
jgi:hypothetical protein